MSATPVSSKFQAISEKAKPAFPRTHVSISSWLRNGQQRRPHVFGPRGIMCTTGATNSAHCGPGTLSMLICVREKQVAILFKLLHFRDRFVTAASSQPQYRLTYPSYLSPMPAFHLFSAPATLLSLTSGFPSPGLCLGCFYKRRDCPLISQVHL